MPIVSVEYKGGSLIEVMIGSFLISVCFGFECSTRTLDESQMMASLLIIVPPIIDTRKLVAFNTDF